MKPVSADVRFPSLEREVLEFWQKNNITQKGLEMNKGSKPFVFYDGPPFATGLPHYGHILAGTLKDVVPRYWAMKGRYVERRWGWDCHGLPVEYEMEKELGLSGLPDIQKFGIAKFNESCREIVLRYTKEWQNVIERTGRWVDFENAYRTMDPKFMESVWWVVKQLWEKGLIYEGYRVMPYSWRISTPLSNFEANLNYKTVQDPAVTVRLKSKSKNRYLLIWTTTPWTLPSHLAIAVHPDIDYVEIKESGSGDHYVLAEARLSHYYKSEEDYEIIAKLKGQELQGEEYEPPFQYFKDHANAFRVIFGDHVTADDGSGLVHMAPAFGEDDMAACMKVGIEPVNPVDASGNFTNDVPDYVGRNVKDADKDIIKELKDAGKLFRHETIEHSYPFCWRSDTPLIYRAISTWFVKLDPIKKKLTQSNKQTHWVPEHLRDGRFGKWLENARDWNISRNRFWGTPIPVWQTEDKTESLCVGSIEELAKLSGKKITDLHKHFIDEITFPSPQSGKLMKRIPEVLDCWFESGSMPYGQAHYPFENREAFEKGFPANFIAEGLDQTRGWFYTLSVLGNILFDQAPFQNVIVNGLILAEDGKKMSKSLKNYPEPGKILDAYGADALRAFLTSSPAARAEELRFSESGVKDVIRSVLLPYWNAYSFFVTYALADGWDPKQFDLKRIDKLSNDLDRWLISRLQTLIAQVDEKMAIYHLYEVIPVVLGFIDELTNWYIRLNRRRFWKEENGDDKQDAYATLYYVLTEFSKILAPVLPFISESIYQNLKTEGAEESVHLCKFPELNKNWIDSELESQMELARTVVLMGRNLRNTHKLKTRQPLKKATVITRDPQLDATIQRFKALIQHELNLKNVEYSQEEEEWVTFNAKPNAKLLGPRLGKKMKAVSAQIRSLDATAFTELEKNGSIQIEGEKITTEEVLIERTPKKEGLVQCSSGVTVLLDNQLDDELISEGRARELVNRIQKLRKDSGFEVSDRILLSYEADSELSNVFAKHESYIKAEVLAKQVNQSTSEDWASEQELDGLKVKLKLTKA